MLAVKNPVPGVLNHIAHIRDYVDRQAAQREPGQIVTFSRLHVLDVAIPGFDQHEKIDPFIVGFAMDDVRHLNIFRRDLNPGFFVRFADDFFSSAD